MYHLNINGPMKTKSIKLLLDAARLKFCNQRLNSVKITHCQPEKQTSNDAAN